ncbi:MAG: RNA methyltransferase [Clostridiales bacterium]|nr:RNA methyltransferase [Clostridiales bacterium]
MSEIITSHNNPTIKLVKSLHTKKYRDQYGLYFVEGWKMVKEAIEENCPIHMLIYSRDFDIQKLELDKIKGDIPFVCVDDNLFKQIGDVKTPQGIIGILIKEHNDIDYVLDTNSGFWVALDRVQDPGNMGTIIRTVDAAGGDGVVLLEGCVDPYNPKTIRSTMGSIFRIPIIKVDNSNDFFLKLKERQAHIITSDMNGENIFNWQGAKSSSIKVLVIGNESKGIRQEIHRIASSTVSIPIIGGAESLNASVAAGIMIYEILRKEGKMGQEISCIRNGDML